MALVVSGSGLRSVGILLSRTRAPPPAPWTDGGPKSLRSPCCGLAIYENPHDDSNFSMELNASPQQGDLRLSGLQSGQGSSGGARTRDRRVPADLRADSLATRRPTSP
ncbi:hypothetical protein PoB_002582500 [Plakobranchus ocellatus]|uniref:Uncharacterized protein n=1 Tax=Plakobranchus ocellatus TaxID=259542 RepID=A0AAV3ZU17_9GAST|nr:hypothetical protein PoB_002582500 [Plakobranchus ocellatus]